VFCPFVDLAVIIILVFASVNWFLIFFYSIGFVTFKDVESMNKALEAGEDDLNLDTRYILFLLSSDVIPNKHRL